MPFLFFGHSSGWHRQHFVLDPQEKRTPIWSSECVMNLNPFWSMSANTGRKVRPWPVCLPKPIHRHHTSTVIKNESRFGEVDFATVFFPLGFSPCFYIFHLEKRTSSTCNPTPVFTWRNLFCNLVRLEFATPEVVETLNFYPSSPQHFCLLV